MRWLLLGTLILSACHTGAPAGVAGDAPPPQASHGPAVTGGTAMHDLVLALETPVPLEGGQTLELTSFTVEQIEAAPGDAGSYPAGSGVVIGVRLGDERADLSRLSPSPPYTSQTIAWCGDHRVEWIDLDDSRSTVTLRVQRLGDGLDPAWQHRVHLAAGEVATLPDGTAIRLDGHSHKAVEEGMDSPLITTWTLERAGEGHPRQQTWNVDPAGQQPWSWHDLVFTLEGYEYGSSMDVLVQRHPLVPVSAATP